MADQVPNEDVSKAIQLLRETKQKADNAATQVNVLVKKVKEQELSTSKGISFLDVKYHLLLSYLINLTYAICQKSKSLSIKGDPAVARMVEIRTVLEKMRPINQKLKYQIDKLIKTATTGIAENDPLRFKPNPDNMMAKLDEDNSEGSSSDEEDQATKKYQPPKLAAMHYEGDDTATEKQQKREQRRMKHMMSSSILKDLQREYNDGPEEVRDTLDIHRNFADKDRKEREEYEEKYMLRMSVSKKDKARSKRLGLISDLGELTKFGGVSALFDEGNGGAAKKRRKSGGAKKGGKRKKIRKN